MFILIAGGGVLGQGLAARLVQGRHDVVVVDENRAVCEQVSSRVGALAIHGTATDIDVLEEAGIRKAEVAIGALPTDADNLAFGVLARNFDVPRVMARMRNPRYESAYKLAGISRVINVSDVLVQQLFLEIEQPTLRQVAAFGEGKASIVVVTIPEGARVHEKTVKEIAQDMDFPRDCVIAGIFREDVEKFVFPRGEAEVRSGDQVFLAADTDNVRKAAQFLHRTAQ
jgi:trk system potassium uptake protein TrkA